MASSYFFRWASLAPPGAGSSPRCAISSAVSSARALFTVSVYSFSGTESATRPAPACT